MTHASPITPEALLRKQPLLAKLDLATVRRLAVGVQRRELRRGDVLFHAGDRPAGIYFVVYGRIKLLSHRGRRGERLTGVVGPGRSLGEPVSILDRPCLVDALASEDSLLLLLPREALLAEIERNPAFAHAMLVLLSRRVESLVQEIGSHAAGDARERLVDYLIRQASGEGEQVVRLPASKAEVASQLHVTAEHFSRLLHELARDGLVRVRGREIVIADVRKLAGHGGPPPLS